MSRPSTFSALVYSFSLLSSVAQGLVPRQQGQVLCPDGKNYAPDDACCPFFSLRDDLQDNHFDNQCGEEVHEMLRLSFHDAIAFSLGGNIAGGGADGSIILFNDTETAFAANQGTDDTVNAIFPFFKKHNVTAGDFIQFGAAVGITNCPGAPQLEFFAGRPNAKVAAADGLVPKPEDPLDTIFARMADAGFEPDELVSLLASHTIARSDTIDPGHAAVPFDSTPFTFDTQIFLEVLLHGDSTPFNITNNKQAPSALADEGAMRLASDAAIARDPRTSCKWQSFVNRQHLMMYSFRQAMAKLAVVGNDKSKLVDCSSLIPVPVPPIQGKHATYPATKSFADVEKNCHRPFPSLATDPGSVTQIPQNVNGSSGSTGS